MKRRNTSFSTALTLAGASGLMSFAVGCGDAGWDDDMFSSENNLSAGSYTVVRRGSGKCLDVAGGRSADGTNIHQWTCNQTGAQVFNVEAVGSNTYRLVNPASGKCLDVNRSGTQNGTNIQLWTCNGTGAQSFRIEALSDGFHQLRNSVSGRCIDVSGSSSADGANVQLWNCNATAAQSFRFDRLDPGGPGDPTDPGDPGDPGDPEPPTGIDLPNNAYCSAVSNWNDAWTAWELEVLELVNQRRAQGATCGSNVRGPAPALTIDGALHCAARNHSKDMVERGYFSHTSPEGQGPGYRFDQAEYTGRGWGENIAAGQSSPSAVITSWMNSPGHCENIMNPSFTKLGVGYYPGGCWRHMWTQTFGR